MKAVIPAAGIGTRFLPVTKEQPKEMLPVLDKPAIQFVVEEAIDSGISDIAIITGRGKRAIENHFDRSFGLEHFLHQKNKDDYRDMVKRIGEMADIMYVRQKELNGLGDAVYTARGFIDGEHFAVMLGDDIFLGATPCTKQLMEVHEKYDAPVLAVQAKPREELGRYGVIKAEPIGHGIHKIVDIIEKPDPAEAPSNLATMGRYILPGEIFESLERTERGWGGEIQLTDAIRNLLEERDFYAYEFRGIRYDIGTPIGWLKSNAELALKDERYGAEFREFLESLLG